jgi:type II secretory pathway component HofQ
MKVFPTVAALAALSAGLVAQVPEPKVTTASIADKGARVSISVGGADIHGVISDIARASRANFVVSPAVQGSISVDFVDVPWREALEASVDALGFRVEEAKGVLRILPGKGDETPPRIFLSFQRAPIQKVIDTIAKISNANIVVGAGVEGEISMQTGGVAWRDALTAVVETAGYELREESRGILRVVAPEKAPAPEPSRLTISFNETDIHDAIDAIAKQAKLNIVVGPMVSGRVSLRLREVGFMDGLQAVVKTLGYGVETDGSGVIRIR